MKYLTAILIPPAAIIDCGRILPGVVNAVVWASSCVLLLTGLVLFLLFGQSATLLFASSMLLWLCAATHALHILNQQNEEQAGKEESRHLVEQMDLMRKAAERLASTRDSQSANGPASSVS